MTEEEYEFVELVRIYNQTEADLLAAFLEDDGLEFQMERSARTLAGLYPATESPVIFRVYPDELDRGKELLEAYREIQARSSEELEREEKAEPETSEEDG